MSGAFGSSKTKTSQKSNQKKNPWDVATPYIKDFLAQDVGPQIGSSTITPGIQESFDNLGKMADAGNPFTQGLTDAASSMLGAGTYSGDVASAFGDYKDRLTGIANGENLNIEANPYLRQLLDQSANSAKNSVAEMFAGAGRGFSPGHAGATATAISEAQLPTLANLFQYEQGRTDAAGRDLLTGAQSSASTQQSLDAGQANIQQSGADMAGKAVDASMWGDNLRLQIEDQLRNLPLDQASKLAAILFPAGQLGGTVDSKGSGTSKQSGFSLGFNLLK